ncbi:ectoine hydrolase [Halomonas cerina]|uniref:Xaa-Pro dipeptidase n=1 Tax=Halomonas cerina TaxID=447424 RepID=A0A839VBA6_9GAMM|nr:ectoine hydrolase [Halomonas cerina]MBB3189997.1 Xaa-Pro dipeptidase [Halomonas cerina]
MQQRDDMTFSMQEHERRLRELRERMEERRVDVAVITDPANLCYLTEYQTTGYSYFQALVVPMEKEPYMITRRLEETNVPARTWVEITRPYSDTGNAIETLNQSLKEFGLHRQCIGYERNSYFFPAYQQDRMRSDLLGTRLADIFGIVEEGRLVKSEEEIAVMRRAAHATEAGMAAGLEAVAVGVNENEIAAETSAAMFRAGGEYPAVMPYIASGPRAMIGHATWEGREVQRNEIVFLEVGGCFRRYHTAMMRTAYIGEPDESLRQAESVVKDALNTLTGKIRPGMTAGEIDVLAREILHDNTVGGYLITRAGYSIGIGFPPSWDEGYMLSLKAGNNTPLRENMTLHLLPWMYGIDDHHVIGLSDTLRVTADGCESLFDNTAAQLTIKA